MKNIEIDFEKCKGGQILFLGKLKAFTKEEIERFLKKFDIRYTENLDEDVKMVIEGLVMSPLDEEISYEAYKKGIPDYPLSEFEKFYAKNIVPDSVLMSLKLSKDQDKILRFLKNDFISDELFLKILKLYDWGEDGLMESDENRAATSSFIKRFYKKERAYDSTVIYSPGSLYTIIANSEDENLLETVLSFPQFRFTQSRREKDKPRDIWELVAFNNFINLPTQKKLFAKRDDRIDYFLALNSSVDKNILKKLYERGDEKVKKAVAANESIDEELFNSLLDENEEILKVVLEYQPINMERFEKILSKNISKEVFYKLGKNRNLQREVLEELLKREEEQLLINLSQNPSLNSSDLENIYKKGIESVYPFLAKNPKIDPTFLKELYEMKDREIDFSLAKNPSTPKEILDGLFDRGETELNKALATNPSLSEEQLRYFMLDQALKSYLLHNKTFTESILKNLGI